MERPPRWEDQPQFFQGSAEAWAASVMGSVSLLKHNQGMRMQPWERTLYVFVEEWLTRQRLTELRAEYAMRHSTADALTSPRKRGRPRSSLRAPVNLRAVIRRLKKDWRVEFRRVADCLVDDISPRLPEPYRTNLLGPTISTDPAHAKRMLIDGFERQRDDKSMT